MNHSSFTDDTHQFHKSHTQEVYPSDLSKVNLHKRHRRGEKRSSRTSSSNSNTQKQSSNKKSKKGHSDTTASERAGKGSSSRRSLTSAKNNTTVEDRNTSNKGSVRQPLREHGNYFFLIHVLWQAENAILMYETHLMSVQNYNSNSGTTPSDSREEQSVLVNATQPREISIMPSRHTQQEQLSHSNSHEEGDDLEMLKKQMEEQGYTPTYQDDIRKVKEYTRQTLFCKLKFITNSTDLFQQGRKTLSKYVMDALNINESFRKDFWNKQAPVLKRALNQRRANASTDIGKVFV